MGLLEHLKPAGNTATLIYQCPASTKADVIVSCCNASTSASDTAFVYLQQSGESLPVSAEELVMIQDINVMNPDNEFQFSNITKVNTISYSLSAGERIVVKSTGGNISFSIVGIERSV